MKHKTNPLFCILFLFVVIFAGLYFWNKLSKNDYEPTKDQSIQIPKKEEFFTLTTVNEESDYAKIDARYPVFKNADKKFNDAIASAVSSAIKEHKQISEENWKARFENQLPGENIEAKPKYEDKFLLSISFEESNINTDFISGIMSYSGYTGGAHGYQNLVAYNYDIKKQKEITFSDYLKIVNQTFDKVQQNAREQLVQKYASSTNKDEKDFNESMKETIFDGTKNESDFSIFTFTKNGAIVYFGQYQVGPYAIGIPEVQI